MQNDLTQWAYLKKVKHPTIDAKVELLIGTHSPKILEPWEVINSQGEGPYAVQTLLGWVVNGPLRNRGDGSTVFVNRISFASKEELLISQYNQDFNQVSSQEKAEMSIEDKTFLEIASEAVLQDRHYDLKLPFRRANVSMPNNHQMAEQCLQSLKRKMKMDQQYKQEYFTFLNDIFENNYAEEVPHTDTVSRTSLVHTTPWGVPHQKEK